MWLEIPRKYSITGRTTPGSASLIVFSHVEEMLCSVRPVKPRKTYSKKKVTASGLACSYFFWAVDLDVERSRQRDVEGLMCFFFSYRDHKEDRDAEMRGGAILGLLLLDEASCCSISVSDVEMIWSLWPVYLQRILTGRMTTAQAVGEEEEAGCVCVYMLVCRRASP